jgi:uncharacterized protein with GYD domain
MPDISRQRRRKWFDGDMERTQTRTTNMPIYITRGRFSTPALQGMMASPEDREASVAKLFAKAGGKLVSYYVTLGEDDWLLIADCPNEKVHSAVVIAAAAGASVTHCQTTVAMTARDAMESFKAAGELAKSFKNAGQ